MVLHELRRYPEVAPSLNHKDRVLQHTPALWAASAMGQIDIALAFGATICCCATADQESIALHEATVLGIVPSSLEALDPRATPSVRHVFTWGEAMSPALASKWRKASVAVSELLISTEYWLSFVCDGKMSAAGRAVYFAVDDVDFAVSTEQGLRFEHGASGELVIRGPMVTHGYLSDTKQSFVEAPDGGQAYLCTRDLVNLVTDASGKRYIEFSGRNDQLVKVAGQFVDLNAAEKKLTKAVIELEGGLIGEVTIIPSLAPSEGSCGGIQAAAHAFVALSTTGMGPTKTASMLKCARASLQRGICLHLVKYPLPRDPITGKVDRKTLLSSLTAESPNLPATPALKERLRLYPCWMLAAVGCAGVDVGALASVLLGQSPSSAPGKGFMLQTLLHLGSGPYLWLFTMQLSKKSVRQLTSSFPFGRLGVVCLLHNLARSRPGRHRRIMLVARTLLAACTAAGVATAWRQRRVLSWWSAFWLNIPDNCGAECRWWLQAKNWLWFFDQFAGGLQDLPAQSLGLMDWIFDVGTQLPYSARELWRAAFVEVPRHVPAALREDLDPLPRRPASIGIPPRPTRPPPVPPAFHDGGIVAAGMPPRPMGAALEQATLGSPARNDVHPPANVSQNCGQEWTLAQSGDGLASAERVQPTVADLSQEGNQTSASSHECFALPACPDPVVARDSTTTEIAGRANDKGLEHSFANASTAVASDTAVQTPTEGSGVTEVKPILSPVPWSCHDCGRPLSWNADWRCEEGVYFCKKCWKEFDDRWWETTSKDVIDVQDGIHDSDRIAKHAGSVMDSVDSGAIARARTAVGARLLQLLAPHFGGAPPLAAYCGHRFVGHLDALP
jgi:hypothetical protein